MTIKIKPIYCIVVLAILFIIIEVKINKSHNNVYASISDVEQITQEKIESIRNTPNTEIAGRNNNICYISQDGDDANERLYIYQNL